MERVNTDSFELHLLEISKRINVNSEYEELTSALITTKHLSTEQAPNVVSGSVKRSRYICWSPAWSGYETIQVHHLQTCDVNNLKDSCQWTGQGVPEIAVGNTRTMHIAICAARARTWLRPNCNLFDPTHRQDTVRNVRMSTTVQLNFYMIFQ